jgi:type I restriction enzyme M protein
VFRIHRASASAEIALLRHDNTLARPYVLTNPPFGGREDDGIEANFPQRFRTRETADRGAA